MIVVRRSAMTRPRQMCFSGNLKPKIRKNFVIKDLILLRRILELFVDDVTSANKPLQENNQVASFQVNETYYQKKGGDEVSFLLRIKPKQDFEFKLKEEFFQSIAVRLSLKELASSEIVTFCCRLKQNWGAEGVPQYGISWMSDNVMNVFGCYAQNLFQNSRLWIVLSYLDNQELTLHKLWNICPSKNCTDQYIWQPKNCTDQYHFRGLKVSNSFPSFLWNKFLPSIGQRRRALKGVQNLSLNFEAFKQGEEQAQGKKLINKDRISN